jgi:hypothetical protein
MLLIFQGLNCFWPVILTVSGRLFLRYRALAIGSDGEFSTARNLYPTRAVIGKSNGTKPVNKCVCVTARSQARATATVQLPPWRVLAQAPGSGRNDRFTVRGPSKGFGMLLGSGVP